MIQRVVSSIWPEATAMTSHLRPRTGQSHAIQPLIFSARRSGSQWAEFEQHKIDDTLIKN